MANKPLDSSLPQLPLGLVGSPAVSDPQNHSVAPPVQPPSPSDSSPLSSLLSAYSNRNSGSTLGSSSDDATVITKDSIITPHSPEDHGVLVAPNKSFLPPFTHPLETNFDRREVSSGLEKFSKDQSASSSLGDPSPTRLRRDGSQETLQAAPAPTLPLPPGPQGEMTQKSAATLELNLPSQPSSAAAPAPLPQQSPQSPANATSASGSAALVQESSASWEPPNPSSAAAAVRSHPSMGAPVVFSGRGTYPVTSRSRITPKAADGADGEASGFKGLNGSAPPTTNGEGQQYASSAPTQSYPVRRKPPPIRSQPSPVARLPTPEYDNEDIKTPVSESIISPVSPTSSPEFSPQRETQDLSVDTDDSLERESSPVDRQPLSASSGSNSCSGSDLDVRTPVQVSPPPAVTNAPNAYQAQFPTRTSSKPAGLGETVMPPGQQEPILNPAGVPAESPNGGSPHEELVAAIDPETTPRARARTSPGVSSDPTQNGMNGTNGTNGTTGTSARENLESNGIEDIESEILPNGWGIPIPEGFIFDAPPVVDRHYRCLTGHRVMHPSRNIYYPLACQTCGVKDTSIRYTCGSCWLRTCFSCRNSLHRLTGNLRELMRQNEAILVEELKEHQDESNPANF